MGYKYAIDIIENIPQKSHYFVLFWLTMQQAIVEVCVWQEEGTYVISTTATLGNLTFN